MQSIPILLIPEKADIEGDEVVATWIKRNGEIKRLAKYWIKEEELTDKPLAIYGNQTFSLVLAQIYQVNLVSPDDTLIARLDKKWTKRNIQLKQIAHLKETDFPVFIKPVIPKLFQSGIFSGLEDFTSNGIAGSEEILVSEIVSIEAEARSYLREGDIKDIALYEGTADIETGRSFLIDFIHQYKHELPRVVVIDVAFNQELGWFILEFNACWGAGLNNCRAEKVIDCIIEASESN